MSIPKNPWFLQAEDDLKMAKLAFANGFYSHLGDLKLNFLTRMHTSTRYPSEDLPPVQLFDQSDGEEYLEIAEKVISFTRTMRKGDG